MAQANATNRQNQPQPQFGGQPWEASMFVRSASYVKTVNEWKAHSPRRSWKAGARRYARANMAAVVMRGDDSAVSFLYDPANDRVVEREWQSVEWVA